MFADKIILITGASRGLGRALALELAAQGAHLILTAKTQGALEETDDAVRAAGAASVVLAPLDITDTASVESLAGAISERFGRLDGVFCCAGLSGDALAPAPHILPKDFHKVFAVNVTAHYHVLRCFDALLRRAENGAHVLFPLDDTVSAPKAFHGVYGASKAAAAYLFGAYAEESAPFNIRVHQPSLPPMSTGLRGKLYPGEPVSAQISPQKGAALCLDAIASYGEKQSPFGKPIIVA